MVFNFVHTTCRWSGCQGNCRIAVGTPKVLLSEKSKRREAVETVETVDNEREVGKNGDSNVPAPDGSGRRMGQQRRKESASDFSKWCEPAQRPLFDKSSDPRQLSFLF